MHHDCLFFVSFRDRAKFEKDPTVDWIEVLLATYLDLGATKVFFYCQRCLDVEHQPCFKMFSSEAEDFPRG